MAAKTKTLRKGKTNRVPRTRAGGEWTESAFWSFLRSNLRRTSQRWPPLARLALNEARRPYKGENKRQKWEYQCAECKEWFKRTEVEVDHIIPCGSLKSWEDFQTFAERLFCEPDGLVVLCEQCHDKKTGRTRKPEQNA